MLKEFIDQFEERTDHLLHLTSKNCKLMKKLRNHAKNSEYQVLIDEFINYVTLNYLSELAEGFAEKEQSVSQSPIRSVFLENEDKDENHTQLLLRNSVGICKYVYWAYTKA